MISPFRRACCGHLLAFVSRIVLLSHRFGATQRATSAVNQFRSLPFLDYDRRLARHGRRHAGTVPNASTPHPAARPDIPIDDTRPEAIRPCINASTAIPTAAPMPKVADNPRRSFTRSNSTTGTPRCSHSNCWPTSQNSLAVESIDRLFRFDEPTRVRRSREPSSGHRSASRRRSPANTPLDVRDRLRPRAIGGVVIAHCPSPALQDGSRSCGA